MPLLARESSLRTVHRTSIGALLSSIDDACMHHVSVAQVSHDEFASGFFRDRYDMHSKAEPAMDISMVGLCGADGEEAGKTPTTASDAAVSRLEPANDDFAPEEFLFAGRPRYTIDGSPLLHVSDIKPLTLAATGGMYAGIMIGLHVYQMETFWQQRSPRFNLIEDGSYAKGVDKCGHFFGSNLMCYYSTEVLQASGLSVEAAHIWGTLMGMVYQSYVEIEDGYGSNWGFSPTDMYANAAGATYFLAQYYFPFLQNFTPKWIYTPAHWIGESARAEGMTFIDDYSSSTFYLSCKVYNLLPQSTQQWWPRWLNVAVGYAARGLDTPYSDAKVILALDYDLPELLPDFRTTVGGSLGDILNWCKQTFNYVKLPSPSLEFGASGMTRFNLLYPFKIRVAGICF